MRTITHKELGQHIKISYEKKIPLFIWGAFGIGKSTIVRDVAKELGINFVDIRISQLEPSDLRGLPKIENGVTEWFKPAFLPTDKEWKGILFFDEINLAPPSIQASSYQLILDRRLGSYTLPDGAVIISAGNRIEDRANIFELPTPLANRFTHLELNTPSVEEWVEWGFKNNIDSRIISFLNFKSSRLFKFDSKIKEKAIPTPRTWEFCSKLILGMPNQNEKDFDLLERLVSSCVGEGTSMEFVAFLRLNRKIDVLKLLKNPKDVKKIKSIDMKYAILSTISEYFRKKIKDKKENKKILDSILRLCVEMEAEFSVLLLRMVKAIDKKFFVGNVVKLRTFNKVKKNYAKYLI